MAAPPAEVTRVYDHIIRLPMHHSLRMGSEKLAEKKKKKKNAEM